MACQRRRAVTAIRQPSTNEDSWLGMKLHDKFQKAVNHLTHPKAIVWTTDRSIQLDGGLMEGILLRAKRHLSMSS